MAGATGRLILHAVRSGAGADLVLLHGLFGRAANFGTVQRRLATRFQVTALDLRNHGDSPHHVGMGYPTMAADVLATLDHLAIEACALVGHSMGGKVALATALMAPQRVRRLVVGDIAPVRTAPVFEAYAAAMAAIPLHPGLTRAAADHALQDVVPDPPIRAFLLQSLRFGPMPTWRIGLPEITAGLPDIVDWPDLGRQYDGPALFVAGEHSDYIRAEHRPAIRALCPHARFVTLRHAGHWLHADNPDGFIATLEAFLSP